jgi:hypothetical protein
MTINQNQSINEALEKIKSYSQDAAEGIRPHLKKPSLKSYQNFLNGMYHYTLKSGDKLMAAANNAPNEELKEFFDHMFREERLHYILAEQDLKGFGLKPDYENTPQAVKDFNKFWDSLANGHFNGYLGALYVFENIADKVADDVKNFLKELDVNEKQRRWLSIHVEADEDHGRVAEDMLLKYLPGDIETAVNAAKEASIRWIAVNNAAFAV